MSPASSHIQLAVRALHQGKVIAYPTESVYGLGCDPNNLLAVKRLLTLKSRSSSKGLILIASEIEQLESWVDFKKIPDMQPIIDSWPGHETWLVPVKAGVSPLLSGAHETLAVRVSAHPVVRDLCQHFNSAITSTSANKNGQIEAKTASATRQYFNQSIDYILPGQVLGNQRPSRIRDAMTGQIIRQ